MRYVYRFQHLYQITFASHSQLGSTKIQIRILRIAGESETKIHWNDLTGLSCGILDALKQNVLAAPAIGHYRLDLGALKECTFPLSTPAYGSRTTLMTAGFLAWKAC